MHKIYQSGVFLGRFLESLLKTGFSLIKNALKTLGKCGLTPLQLTAATSATNTAIKNIFGSSMTMLVTPNEEINAIMKIVKLVEESDLSMKDVSRNNQT